MLRPQPFEYWLTPKGAARRQTGEIVVTLSEVGTIRSGVKKQVDVRPQPGEIVGTLAPVGTIRSRLMSRYQNSTWTMGREILVTWLIAAVVMAVLLLLPARQSSSLDQTLNAISPASAGEQASGETEFPTKCLERDYANERC
jgi:hypothetical protein